MHLEWDLHFLRYVMCVNCMWSSVYHVGIWSIYCMLWNQLELSHLVLGAEDTQMHHGINIGWSNSLLYIPYQTITQTNPGFLLIGPSKNKLRNKQFENFICTVPPFCSGFHVFTCKGIWWNISWGIWAHLCKAFRVAFAAFTTFTRFYITQCIMHVLQLSTGFT